MIAINIFKDRYSDKRITNNTVAEKITQPSLNQVSKQTVVITPNPFHDDNWITYKVSDYSFEFQYLSTLTLIENPEPMEKNFKIGIYDGDELIMTIRPHQSGIGFDNSDQEISIVPVINNGNMVAINNKTVEKYRIDNKSDATTFITLIPYPEVYKRDYSIMIPSFFDANNDLEMTKIYDQIISTIRFVN